MESRLYAKRRALMFLKLWFLALAAIFLTYAVLPENSAKAFLHYIGNAPIGTTVVEHLLFASQELSSQFPAAVALLMFFSCSPIFFFSGWFVSDWLLRKTINEAAGARGNIQNIGLAIFCLSISVVGVIVVFLFFSESSPYCRGCEKSSFPFAVFINSIGTYACGVSLHAGTLIANNQLVTRR